MTTSEEPAPVAMSGTGFVTAWVHSGPAGPPITMAFPCYAGPALRGLTTILLYREKIHVSIPSLLDDEQYFLFRKAGDLAHQHGRSCLEAFALADHQFRLAVEQSTAARQALAPLGNHFEFLQIVNDGSPEWYDSTLKNPDAELLGAVQSALSDVQQLNVAAREFIWRVFSANLHFEGDLARVVDYLERHRTDRGSTRACSQSRFSTVTCWFRLGKAPSPHARRPITEVHESSLPSQGRLRLRRRVSKADQTYSPSSCLTSCSANMSARSWRRMLNVSRGCSPIGLVSFGRCVIDAGVKRWS